MTKKGNKTHLRNSQITFIVKTTAELTGFTPDYIYKILGGTRENEEVLSICMHLIEGCNSLKKEVKMLIPFN